MLINCFGPLKAAKNGFSILDKLRFGERKTKETKRERERERERERKK